MAEPTIEQYLDLLVRSIPAATIERNEELFLKFLECFPNPLKVKQMSREEREEVASWGPEMKHFLAGIELGQLIANSHSEVCGHAYSSAALGKVMIDHFRHEEQECVAVAYTDIHNNIIDYQVLFRGGQSECLLYPDRIFAIALRQSASGLVMIHNHPSGNVTPSTADLNFVKRLNQGSQLLGLQLLDFLIVGQDHYYSWREDQQEDRQKVKK